MKSRFQTASLFKSRIEKGMRNGNSEDSNLCQMSCLHSTSLPNLLEADAHSFEPPSNRYRTQTTLICVCISKEDSILCKTEHPNARIVFSDRSNSTPAAQCKH